MLQGEYLSSFLPLFTQTLNPTYIIGPSKGLSCVSAAQIDIYKFDGAHVGETGSGLGSRVCRFRVLGLEF